MSLNLQLKMFRMGRICRWNHVSVFSALVFCVYASRLLDLKGFRLFQGGGPDQKRRKHIEATGRDKKTRLLVDSPKFFGGRTSQTTVYSSNPEGTVRPSFTLFPWFFMNMDESLLPSCRSSLLRQWVNLFGLVEENVSSTRLGGRGIIGCWNSIRDVEAASEWGKYRKWSNLLVSLRSQNHIKRSTKSKKFFSFTW